MKRILFIFSVVVLSLAFIIPAFSANWEAKSVTREKSLDVDNFIGLKDAQGNQFLVEFGGDISEDEAAKILKIKDTIFAWQNIKIKEVRFFTNSGVLQALIVPEKMVCDSIDVIPFLTSGMSFEYTDGVLLYNFRIKKDNFFLRINGEFVSEKVLSDKVAEAVRTPKVFIQRRDPDYMLSSMDRLSNENDRLKRIIIALYNKGIFSGPKPLNDKVIDKVVSIKTNKRTATVKEIEDQMKAEKMEVSTGEIEIILQVYFSEFPK